MDRVADSPGSHKLNFPLPDEVRMASTAGIAPPMVAPALKAGDAILFLEVRA